MKQYHFAKYLNFTYFGSKNRKLVVGTDCSGIEAPIQALELLGIPHKHLFSCDNDPHVVNSIKANYNPKYIFKDIMTRDHSKLPKLDLYVAGFPCQSFSLLGKRDGFEDPIKGTVFFECWDTIRYTKPKIFILENVKGLINHDNGNTFGIIMKYLNLLQNYNIYYDIYNTKDYGIPQNRERIYIIGLDKSVFKQKFIKPKPIPLEINVMDLVDTRLGPNTTFGELTEHKLDILEELLKNGKIDDLNEPWSVNLNVSSSKRTNPMKYICPCLLAGNGGDCVYYLTSIRRRYTPKEYLKLQGFPDTFKQEVSNSKLYKQVGNSMSVNVLCFIYQQIFKLIN